MNTHSSSASYLFYDLETSGLNKAFDQIIQFAAIRTNLEFKELERHEIIIKPNPDNIPSPFAAITHRTPIHSWQSGEPELLAIEKIHKILNAPGTISLGYNTLGFDDEFLRFSFYRNLLSPYTHQFANQCSRADLYPIAALYFLFNPSCLNWPTLENGKISLKLENISKLNHLASGAAHTAIVDVEATVGLAKIFAKDKAMWRYALGYFNKISDSKRITQLPSFQHMHLTQYGYGILVDGIFGSDANFHAPVLALGSHKHYKNQSLFLRLDTENLNQSHSDNFQEHVWIISKKIAEPGFILPANRQYSSRLSALQQTLLTTNLEFLQNNFTLLAEIQNYYLDYKHPPAPSTDVDAALYLNEFLTNQEQAQCQKFHHAAHHNKSLIIDQIQKPYLHELAIRALGRFDKKLLSPEQLALFEHYLEKVFLPEATVKAVILDYKNQPKLTRPSALNEIETIRAHAAKNQLTLDMEQEKILSDLEGYLFTLSQPPVTT